MVRLWLAVLIYVPSVSWGSQCARSVPQIPLSEIHDYGLIAKVTDVSEADIPERAVCRNRLELEVVKILHGEAPETPSLFLSRQCPLNGAYRSWFGPRTPPVGQYIQLYADHGKPPGITSHCDRGFVWVDGP